MKKLVFACLALLSALCCGQRPWEGQVFYQVFPRSYRDSNGDRIGDLKGISQGLAAIKELGCTALLINPIVRSRVYHNYFADDLRDVDPDFGTLKDFRDLVARAHRLHMKVVLDMEPQYVADRHPWLAAVLKDPSSPYRAYLWDQGEKVLTKDYPWYNHQRVLFASVDPDNPQVRKSITGDFLFWAKQGVDGFRVDHMMDDFEWKHTRTGMIAKLWAPLVKEVKSRYPRMFFVGEQADGAMAGFAKPILNNSDTDAVFAFGIRSAIVNMDIAKLREAFDMTWAVTPPDKTQLTFLESHDTERVASALPDRARQELAAFLLFTMKGAPVVYMGQELGMLGKQGDWHTDGNDIPIRLAFRWGDTLDAPFTATWYKDTGPWWSTAYSSDRDGRSLPEQRSDPHSLWHFYQDMIWIRTMHPALWDGSQTVVDVGNPHVFAFVREDSESFVVLANLSREQQVVHIRTSTVRLKDPRAYDQVLPPWGHALLAASNGGWRSIKHARPLPTRAKPGKFEIAIRSQRAARQAPPRRSSSATSREEFLR